MSRRRREYIIFKEYESEHNLENVCSVFWHYAGPTILFRRAHKANNFEDNGKNSRATMVNSEYWWHGKRERWNAEYSVTYFMRLSYICASEYREETTNTTSLRLSLLHYTK